jgi:hypothetical protein
MLHPWERKLPGCSAVARSNKLRKWHHSAAQANRHWPSSPKAPKTRFSLAVSR